MSKLVLIVTALGALVVLPPVKAVYDDLVTTMLTPIAPNTFVLAFFKLLPYALLALIVFGTIFKLFRPSPPPGPPGGFGGEE